MCQPFLPCPCPTTPILVHGIDKKGAKTSILSRKKQHLTFSKLIPQSVPSCILYKLLFLMMVRSDVGDTFLNSLARQKRQSASFWSNDAMGDTKWGAMGDTPKWQFEWEQDDQPWDATAFLFLKRCPSRSQAAAARCIVAFRFVLSGFALACVCTAVGGRNSPWLGVTVHVACHSQWTDGLIPFISLQPPRESKLHCSQCAMMECSAYSVPAGHWPVQRIDVHQTSIFQDSCGQFPWIRGVYRQITVFIAVPMKLFVLSLSAFACGIVTSANV